MSITIKDVEKVAQLARLEFSADEKEKLMNHLEQIVSYVEKLNELDTEGVEPTKHVVEMTRVLREDKIKNGLTQEDAVTNAPKSKQGYFSVPKVIK